MSRSSSSILHEQLTNYFTTLGFTASSLRGRLYDRALQYAKQGFKDIDEISPVQLEFLRRALIREIEEHVETSDTSSEGTDHTRSAAGPSNRNNAAQGTLMNQDNLSGPSNNNSTIYDQAKDSEGIRPKDGEEVCSICLRFKATDQGYTNCTHKFCKPCIKREAVTCLGPPPRGGSCPLCLQGTVKEEYCPEQHSQVQNTSG